MSSEDRGEYEVRRDHYRITTDRRAVDVGAVLELLHGTFWAAKLTRPALERSIEHSIPFVLVEHGDVIGFARVITDYAIFAYLCDVVIEPSRRGRGLGKWLVESILAHPALPGLRRICLITRDAPWLYEPFGFTTDIGGSSFMEKKRSTES